MRTLAWILGKRSKKRKNATTEIGSFGSPTLAQESNKQPKKGLGNPPSGEGVKNTLRKKNDKTITILETKTEYSKSIRAEIVRAQRGRGRQNPA